MTLDDLLFAVFRFALLLPAIIAHEVAHGYVAYLLGDPTAKEAGRLSPNPLAHIDPWGTVLMPAILLMASGGRFAFGYAKPVPVNPMRMTKVGPRDGMLLTGIAGPVTNLVLAGIAALVLLPMRLGLLPAPEIVVYGLFYWVYLNVLLALFNLIPLPPMDGSRVVQRFLSGGARRFYAEMERYGFMILIGIVWIVPQFTGFDPLEYYFRWTVDPVVRLLTGM